MFQTTNQMEYMSNIKQQYMTLGLSNSTVRDARILWPFGQCREHDPTPNSGVLAQLLDLKFQISG